MDDKGFISVLTMKGENDEGHEYDLICRFPLHGREYIAVTPREGEDGRVELYRCSGDDNELHVSNIRSDMELDNAAAEYKRLVGFDSIDETPEQDDDTFITLADESGGERVCQILKTFKYDRLDIIAVVPVDTVEGDDATIQLFAYRVVDETDDTESIKVEEIPEHLFDGVQDYFVSMIQAQ